MDYRIAICDDNQLDIDYIKKMVVLWHNHRTERILINSFLDAESFLSSYQKCNYDLLLLDIKLGMMDGVELAKIIRKDNQQMQIIFITGYSDYVFQGYDVSAIHYLLKPVKENVLFKMLDRAVSNLQKQEEYLFFSLGNVQKRIPVSSIVYVECFLHNLKIATTSESYTVMMTIRDMEKRLGDGFVRCHRSYIIGIKYISSISRTEILLDSGVRIPLSRTAQKEVYHRFADYYKDCLK